MAKKFLNFFILFLLPVFLFGNFLTLVSIVKADGSTVPSAPFGLSDFSTYNEIGLLWEEPANGGAEILDYQIEYRLTGSSTWEIWQEHPAFTSWSSNLFASGHSYDFKIRARNEIGTGPASQAITISFNVVQAYISGISQSASQITLFWNTSSYSTTQVGYGLTTAYGSTTVEKDLNPMVTEHQQVITDLAPCTTYNFKILGTDSLGNSVHDVDSNNYVTTLGCTTPSEPTNIEVVGGNGQATVSFTPPYANGSSPITGYTIISEPGNITATGSSSPITVTGLTNGTSYSFRVAALNSVGAGPYSATSSAVVPLTTPSAPTNVVATRGNGQVNISFSPSQSNGGTAITSYSVVSEPGNFTAAGSSSPIIVTGLTNGTSYVFSVSAANSVGAGASSASSTPVIPATVPDVPTGVSLVRGNGQLTVLFAAPLNNGGLPVTSYTVTSDSGNISATGSSSPITVAGLTNGTSYTFTVKANNEVGSSSSSSPQTAVPATVPGIPSNLFGVSSEDFQTDLTWDVPSDGGASITYYEINYKTTGSSTWHVWPATVFSPSFSTTLLTPGISYDFRVRAVNNVGASSNSDPVTVLADGQPVYLGSESQSAGRIILGWSTNYYSTTQIEYGLTPSYGSSTVEKDLSPLVLDHEATINGLAACTDYHYRFINVDNLGNKIVSQDSIFETSGCQVPSEPLNISVVRGNGQATVSFNSPYGNGSSPITGYTVISGPGNFTATGSSSPITVTGLTNGTSYTFRVAAINSVGTGPFSATSSAVIPLTVPSAPTNVVATRGNGQASVAFSPPGSNGGSAITSYSIVSEPGNFTATGSSSPITVTGLTNGTSYNFFVVATNEVGDSSRGQTSSLVVPATFPGVPANLVVAVDGNVFNLNWQAPTGNGLPVTMYQLEYHTQFSYPFDSYIWLPLATTSSSSISVTGLTSGVSYAFRVGAVNGVGDGAFSESGTSTLGGSVFSDQSSTSYPSNAVISWKTGSLSSTEVNYGLTNSYGSSSVLKDASVLVLNHSENLQNLLSCTTYHYQLSAYDSLGNHSTSSDQTFSTTGCPVPATPTVTSGGGGGGGPSINYSLLRKPIGGQFKFLVNNGAPSTNSNKFIISLDGGPDASAYLISENQNFSGAILRAYTTSTIFQTANNLGEKNLYLKFANFYNYYSEILTAKINLIGTSSENTQLSTSSDLISTSTIPGFYVGDVDENELFDKKPSSRIKLELVKTSLISGNKNAEVKKLQNFLISQGLLTQDAATSFYGAQTRAAVEKFQLKYKIISPKIYGYGIFGLATKKKVNDLINEFNKNLTSEVEVPKIVAPISEAPVIIASSSPIKLELIKTTLSPGNKNGEVKKLQNFLVAQGLLAQDATTSFYGAQTRVAVEKFQLKYKITSPKIYGYGIFGLATKAKANKLIGQ
ncbi:MAG: fibronectin type III domain-containing protein [Patescibacteria group bacterium]